MSTTPPSSSRNQTGAWTTEALDFVCRAWTRDGLSAGEIRSALAGSLQIFVSRNAIIGQIARKGWVKGCVGSGAVPGVPTVRKAREKPCPTNGTRPKAAPSKAVKRAGPVIPAIAPGQRGERWGVDFPVGDHARGIAQLKAGTCRWPVGDDTGAAQKFCGATTAGSKPYCPGHALRAYVPVRGSPRAPYEAPSRRQSARRDDHEDLRDLVEVFT